MLKPKTEWPDVIVEGDHPKRVVLQHTMVFSRKHFDDHPISEIAMILIKMGKAGVPIKSTDEVRKYIFEVEIVD